MGVGAPHGVVSAHGVWNGTAETLKAKPIRGEHDGEGEHWLGDAVGELAAISSIWVVPVSP